MQTVNDYRRDVYNGDTGEVADVDPETGELTARFHGAEHVYAFGELDALVPAYAATVHKSQGSEYPAVVIPVLTQHYVMLQRNLLYTALTRAKQAGGARGPEEGRSHGRPQRRRPQAVVQAGRMAASSSTTKHGRERCHRRRPPANGAETARCSLTSSVQRFGDQMNRYARRRREETRCREHSPPTTPPY